MKTKTMIPMLMAVLLAACSSGFQGTYQDQMGMSSYKFDGNGTVLLTNTLGGVELELQYEVDGDKVRVTNPQVEAATLIFTRVDENTLSGPTGLRLVRMQ